MRERKQKKNPIFISKSVRVRLRESVRLRECVNAEFDWEVKRGFKKASVSRAVRLRECPLADSWLYKNDGLVMLQRVYYCIENICCSLLFRMARIEMDWSLKN